MKTLLTNGRLATISDQDYGLIEDACLVLEDNRIAWVGPAEAFPEELTTDRELDLQGRLVTPGLIDCHTHLVHGGDRVAEFELRLNGASYEELARAGGGILSTVNATRSASEDELTFAALGRLDTLIGEGVTAVEIKSGYGLDNDTEIKMLRVARDLGRLRDIRVSTSFLGAHALPPQWQGDADGYIDQCCIPALRAAAEGGLVDAVDGFCEGIAFTPAQISRVFDAAADLGLPVRLHAEQLSHLGGAKLAASRQALSADHLEYATAEDARAMAEAGTVAVLLPGAFYTLRETQLPPIMAFREHRTAMAVATDCNPGSSPLTSLLLAMNMAATLFRMTPQEILCAVTTHAGQAIGMPQLGRLEIGAPADLAIWNCRQPAELAWRIGYNPLWKRIFDGRI